MRFVEQAYLLCIAHCKLSSTLCCDFIICKIFIVCVHDNPVIVVVVPNLAVVSSCLCICVEL